MSRKYADLLMSNSRRISLFDTPALIFFLDFILFLVC